MGGRGLAQGQEKRGQGVLEKRGSLAQGLQKRERGASSGSTDVPRRRENRSREENKRMEEFLGCTY